MMDDINILKLASAMARHSTARHQVLSQNVANADTNNYKAKDLEPFAQAYSRVGNKLLDSSSLQTSSSETKWRTELIADAGPRSPNGNTVSIEDQLMRSVEAQGNFDAATTIYKKTIEMLRTSLGSGR